MYYFLFFICLFFYHRMEGDYENVSHMKLPAYTETFDTLPQGMQQPVSVPEKKELQSNSNVNAGTYDTPSQCMEISKSNTQEEGTTVFLQFNELRTAAGKMMLVNMVSKKAVS